MGRIAVVTGGTRGLGLAITLELARRGDTPAMVYRQNGDAAKDALEAVRKLAPEARAYQADISEPRELEPLVDRISEELGPIQILVNNAYRGGKPPVKTHEVSPDDWIEDLSNNLNGQFFMSRACIPSMLETGYGRIVFIGSLAMRGERGRVSYATAKRALLGLSTTIAQEYAKNGVTSNVVAPGFIETGAFQRLPEAIKSRALSGVPARRAGRPEEVAKLVAHLASEAAAYTNGQVIGVDGAAL